MDTTRRIMLKFAAVMATGASVGTGRDGLPFTGTTTDQRSLVDGNNQVCFDLYARLGTRDGNVFFSPFSVSSALAMTYAGARGETARQMASALRFPVSGEPLHQAFAVMLRSLNRSGSTPRNELRIANALWPQAGLPLARDFERIARDLHGAGLTAVDFERPEQARATINAWVEQQTQDRIKDLMPEGALTPDTRLVLTNAIYFKGKWRRAFLEAETRPDKFIAPRGRVVPGVPFMSQHGTFRYLEGEGFQALALPYDGDELSMVVLLPQQVDRLSELERRLTAPRVTEWLATMPEREVYVALPRFKVTAAFKLKPVLSQLGMPLAFERGRADFSGIASGKPLYLSEVMHKAYVEVNEKGTEAAAATGAVVQVMSMRPAPPVFRADHPFIFVIRDNATASLLFAGRVVDPASM